jgi:hypothetical protein
MDLRKRLVKSSQLDEQSDTVYCRGFSSKRFSDDEVISILSIVEQPCDIDLTKRQRFGILWAKYRSVTIAHETIVRLHQSMHNGVSVSLRFELGLDDNGKPIVPKTSHCTIVRHIMYKGQPCYSINKQLSKIEGGSNLVNKKGGLYCAPCKEIISNTMSTRKADTNVETDLNKNDGNMTPSGSSGANNRMLSVNYSHKSIVVGSDLEVPFPSGLYLTRMVALSRRADIHHQDPLLTLLTTTALEKCQHKYAKEISEVMAMVDGVERGLKMAFGKSPVEYVSSPVTVYVLGDGRLPLCAAALCLHFPISWCYYSIDPILESIDVTDLYQFRFHQIPCMSQDFIIPLQKKSCEEIATDSRQDLRASSSPLSIIVACHSHAPLQEFWDRISSPKLGVVMACCASFSKLSKQPLFEFDDFEVYSAKRHIQIFAD